MGPVACARASGDMVESFVSGPQPWGHSGDQVMLIFGSNVGSQIPNIGDLEVYGRI